MSRHPTEPPIDYAAAIDALAERDIHNLDVLETGVKRMSRDLAWWRAYGLVITVIAATLALWAL